MEERAVQRDQLDGSWEGGHDEGKANWKKECPLSSLLKHSCLLCWSSPRDTDIVETDERVLSKASEIRVRRPRHLALELENAVTVENLELQEQQSDRKELEETLVKLEKHKEKLTQQIKATRQLCYEESQQILSLQAEEVKRESQVEEYERELSRARWRLRKLKEEVKQAKRKMEEAGERNCPLQDSIRQSYEEILQEEHTLCSVSGGAVTPESQLDGSTSPADTTEEEPLPMRPWGRSQSLPAYADLIMVASSAPFCNNLADTREEVDDSSSSSPKMDRSNLEDDPEEGVAINEEQGGFKEQSILNKLDFYQADPFAQCQISHDLFNEDLFPKTDSSDGFTSDPFKGTDPFAADNLFPEANIGCDEAAVMICDEADTSLSCAENKASTGTQCFESEFPDEDSDIELSYSQEDFDTIPGADDNHGFKPIQSSSEELGPEPIRCWNSQGQYSVESDPSGYELDLGAVSLPSDIKEHSLGSLAGEFANVATTKVEEAKSVPELGDHQALWVSDRRDRKNNIHSLDGDPVEASDRMSNNNEDPGNVSTHQNSVDSHNLYTEPESQQTNLSFDYEPTSQSSFDPYGFKLSPEHSSHTLLDPDETELSPVPSDQDLAFEHSSSQPDPLNFYSYEYEIPSSQMVQDSDPYGFKLSLEEDNQEVPEPCCDDNMENLALGRFDNEDNEEPFNYSNQEVPEFLPHENQEVLIPRSDNNQELLDVFKRRSQEGLEFSSLVNSENVKLVSKENQEFLSLCSPENQEIVEHDHFVSDKELEQCINDNQEVLEFCSHGNLEQLDFTSTENQEVLELDSYGNREVVENQEALVSGNHENQGILNPDNNKYEELLDLDGHNNQEVLDLVKDEVHAETNNNQCILKSEFNISPTNNSSDSDVASEELLGLEPSSTSAGDSLMGSSIMPTNKTCNMSNKPASHHLLDSDPGSVFRDGGYIGCPDVADDLEPMFHRQVNTVAEPVQPVRPVRPPRPSLRAKEKAPSPTQGIDLK
ncbi:uncharacterized protein LOC133411652 isoform X2 [Phycodurus eques]|uniref:uncharacterized protein LOC133411652 isoform X2 n=1 Tax=Phycodurus eques TaxID=693459 RepID=UPI002ACE6734|nr:uncharacterized protein LOC133411652 isoform X2 [Phycodurus eques]